MKITALRLFNVKRFAGRGVAIEGISDGVNVLCAANEFGKSTSFEALHALFFQSHASTSGDVRNLRPYSGGNPILEADLTTSHGRFRITKQYYGGRYARVTDLTTGRLVAQADEAENFIADLIKGGTAGPAGLLWVRQGITGIEKRSKTEEEGEKEVRRSLLESVQGEVEAVTGGRRMADIMDATQAALAELVTATGRPKTGGRYAAARDESERLLAEERRLAGEVTALREALDRRASAVRRLAELDRTEDRHQRRQKIAEAQAAFDAARAQSDKLKAAEAELKLARDRRESAHTSLTSLRGALAKAHELQRALREAEQGRSDAIGRRREADEAARAARAAVDAAEVSEREARELLARLDAAIKAREAAERRAELDERLRKAEAARRTLEDGEAKLGLLRIPPEAVEELQAVEVEIARLRAIAEAARPSVAITYQDGAGPVHMDGAPLMAGEERTYDAQAALSVPGIGTITLRSNRSAPDDDRLMRAEAKRRKLLAAIGIADLAAALKRQVDVQRIETTLRELQVHLSLLAPDGLTKLRAQVAESTAAGAELLEFKADPTQVRASLAQAEEQRATARQALREVEELPSSAVEAFVAAERTLATINADWTRNEAILGPEATRGDREKALADTLDAHDQSLAAAEAHFATLRAGAVDLQSAGAALARARSIEEAAEKEAGTLRETVAGLNAEIRTRSDEAVEETWRETGEALAAAQGRVAAFEKDIAVLQRLSAALEAARAQARELYLGPVMAELKPLLGLLFDDASITFDDKTLLPQTLMRNGQEEDVDRLSGGMREQLSVLTRLAFARLLARDGRPAPVILDDALVYSDDDRIEKMFDALHRQSRDQQIIVFSCRQRAFQTLGGNVLQMTKWSP